MRAIIPVAGIGSRLRPHTFTLPKVLLNVAGKPIIGHILDKIIENGFDEVTLVVGYLGEMIQEYVDKNYSIKVDYINQEERRGLAHSIYIAQHTFSDEPITIILGDTIFDVDLKTFINSGYSSLGVKNVTDARRFGVAETNNGFVTNVIEKPENIESGLALVGLYYIKESNILKECISQIVENDIKTKNEYQLTDALQLMINKGVKIKTYPVEGWFDCGKPETLLLTNKHLLLEKSEQTSIPDVVIIPPVYISKESEIHRSVIGPFATISPGVKISESIIKNSIIGDDSRVEKALLEDTIIGNNVIVSGVYRKLNAGDSTEIDYF
jgi:glucose-1-phosphate thymidylyltransferase